MSSIAIASKILAESLTSLYPVFVKNIGLSIDLQLWSRCFTYVVLSLFFIDYKALSKQVFSKMGMLLSIVTMIHIYVSYKGFMILESGTAYTIFYLYPLMIVLLSNQPFHPILLLSMVGVWLMAGSFHLENLYGIGMVFLAAFTEAIIYFIVRKIPTSNWHHIFISYIWGAIFLTGYYWNDIQLSVIGNALSLSVLINGVIGAAGYWLRFYSMGLLSPMVYALLSYVGIVMSFVYGWWFNQEQVTINKIIGALCILIPNIWIKLKHLV